MSEQFDRFTEPARQALSLAQSEALRLNHHYVGTEHILLGLLHEGDGIVARVLGARGVDLARIREAVEFIVGRGDRSVPGQFALTPRAKKVIELAIDEARKLNHAAVGPEHLLVGLLREGEGIGAGVLESLGVKLEVVRALVLRALESGEFGRRPGNAAPTGAQPPTVDPGWSEQDSQAFIDYGRYFVPQRETQIEILCDLVPPPTGECHVVELACGEGLLAGALLERFPDCTVHGYDGSTVMLERARARLAHYGERFGTRLFELAERDWREMPWPVHAVLSSLAIHHLDGAQKRELFADVYRMLAPGGVFLIADVIQPAGLPGTAVAGKAWDRAVEQRALELDGNTAIYDYFRDHRWNMYHHPDPMDKPSSLFDQLKWLAQAGFIEVDAFWLEAGHAIFGGTVPATDGP